MSEANPPVETSAGSARTVDDVVRLAAQVLAAGAGFVGIVYVWGAVYFRLRLHVKGIPATPLFNVVSRDALISLGTSTIAVPWVVFSALAAVSALLAGHWQPSNRSNGRRSPVRKSLSVLAALLVFGGVLLLLGALIRNLIDSGNSALWFNVAFVGSACASLGIGVWLARDVSLPRFPRLAWVVAAVGLIAAIAHAAVQLPNPLDHVRVCRRSPLQPVDGGFVADTASSVYVFRDKVLVAVPRPDIRELRFGKLPGAC